MYAQEAPKQPQYVPAGAPIQKLSDKPRLHSQLEHLSKLIGACHSIASNLQNAADRIVGPVPQDASKAMERAPSSTVEQKLTEATDAMEALVRRLEDASHRIDAAV